MGPFYKFLISTIIIACSITPAYAQIKCWENSEGIRECGEKVPPEYSQKSHKILSNQGLTIEESERAKTKEERLEMEKLAKIEAKRIAEEEKQKIQDKALLATYIEKEDIQKFANEKIADINSIIEFTQKRNTNIQETLSRRVAHRNKLIESDKEPTQLLLDDIEAMEKQVANNQKFIEKNRQLQEEVAQEYAEKTERFIYLTGNKK